MTRKAMSSLSAKVLAGEGGRFAKILMFTSDLYLISTKEGLHLRKTCWTILKTTNVHKTEKKYYCFVVCVCQVSMHCVFSKNEVCMYL